MSEHTTETPAWIYKRDGRLVPFEADRISRALFAATESLGRPNAFLARELTDGVLHFLSAELESATPTTEQVRELVIKVVRELGQPALAEAFALRQPARAKAMPEDGQPATLTVPLQRSPEAFTQACLRAWSLQQVFARDLAAAHHEGLLTLTGLEAPLHLAGCLLAPTGNLLDTLLEVRRFAHAFVVLDGVEYLLSPEAETPERAAEDYVRELHLGLRASELRAIVNLNTAQPPSWAGELAHGPLFADQRHAVSAAELEERADILLEALLADAVRERVRIDWHLGDRDFLPAAEARLLRVARRAIEEEALAFTFDRPRRPIALAEGIDRRCPAVLLTVGLHLPRLAAQPGLQGHPERLVQKLGSLARLALSAATQKREFLRRHRPETARGFLLERARLVAAPVGLEEVTRTFTGRGLCEGKPAVDFARQVVQRLRDVLRQDGRACLMETGLDATSLSFEPGEGLDSAPRGVARADWKGQLRAAGALHAVAEMGTAGVYLAEDTTAEQLAEGLRWAWQQTDVVRVRFMRAAPAHRQMVLEEKAV